MARHSLTYQQANARLVAYETANSDLQPHVRRLLGLFTIARASTRGVVRQILGHDSASLFRDHAKRWWMVLYYSGLAKHWQGFKDRGQNEGLTQASKWLRREVTREEWKLFRRRAGATIGFRIWNRSSTLKGHVIWSKGGSWDRKSPFTKILVLGEHLPERPLLQLYQRKLGHYHVRLLERECFHMIDPDKVSVPDAKHRVVGHVQRRIPQLLGYKTDLMSKAVAAWFFQTEIPVGGHRYVGPRPPRGRRYPVTYVDRTARRQRSWNH